MIVLGDIAAVITPIISVWLSYPDPEHQRANGNLKYFEFQLEKQKKAAEEETEKEETKEKADTPKKRTKKSKKQFSLIPERKKYEMLCRGEGIRLVRNKEKIHNNTTALSGTQS